MNWHDGRQNRCLCLRYEYRSLRARYLGKGVGNNVSGGRKHRCCFFESIVVVVVIKRVMETTEEVDLADAGHTVVRCMKRQNKETKQKVQRTQR
jgi:hypothetical protein